MAFLRNRAVNWINLHSAIQALAQGMGGAFVLVFLLRAGISLPASLCAFSLLFVARFSIRPWVLVAAKRVGLKPLIIAGCLGMGAEYLVVATVRGLDWSLLAYCLVGALGGTFYWTCYHAYFALIGDNEHRGHQISASVALSTIVGIAAPLLGAWALLRGGPWLAFGAAGAVQALAALPLIAMPNLYVQETAPRAYRAAAVGAWLFAADGWFAATYEVVWAAALYYSLDESLSAYGGALAIAALVGAVSGLFLGRHIDRGHGQRSLAIAFLAVAVTLIVRSLSLGTPWLAVAANAMSAVATCLLRPAQMSPIYNLAKHSPCALRFNIAAEGGWDTGCFLGCLAAAALIAQGVPLAQVIPLGFLGWGVQLVLLSRLYARNDAASVS